MCPLTVFRMLMPDPILHAYLFGRLQAPIVHDINRWFTVHRLENQGTRALCEREGLQLWRNVNQGEGTDKECEEDVDHLSRRDLVNRNQIPPEPKRQSIPLDDESDKGHG